MPLFCLFSWVFLLLFLLLVSICALGSMLRTEDWFLERLLICLVILDLVGEGFGVFCWVCCVNHASAALDADHRRSVPVYSRLGGELLSVPVFCLINCSPAVALRR